MAFVACKKSNKSLNDPIIELNTTDEKFIEGGETVWFQADLQEGVIYQLKWLDGWFDPYEGSVWMTGFEQDQTTEIFDWQRTIQMVGSPKTFMLYESQTFYLKCENYSDDDDITIAIELFEIDKGTSHHIDLNHTEYMDVPVGETHLYDFDVIADSTYTITIMGSDEIGAYGDEAHVILSAFGDMTEGTYFYEEEAGNTWAGGPNVLTITPVVSEKIYLTVTAAYWFTGRSLSVLIED